MTEGNNRPTITARNNTANKRRRRNPMNALCRRCNNSYPAGGFKEGFCTAECWPVVERFCNAYAYQGPRKTLLAIAPDALREFLRIAKEVSADPLWKEKTEFLQQREARSRFESTVLPALLAGKTATIPAPKALPATESDPSLALPPEYRTPPSVPGAAALNSRVRRGSCVRPEEPILAPAETPDASEVVFMSGLIKKGIAENEVRILLSYRRRYITDGLARNEGTERALKRRFAVDCLYPTLNAIRSRRGQAAD